MREFNKIIFNRGKTIEVSLVKYKMVQNKY